MTSPTSSCPLVRSQVVDRYFLEHRAKLLDIAAFLDRVDRAGADAAVDTEDFRLVTLRQALEVLLDGQPARARRVLEVFSDPTTEPIPSAGGLKGALGAWPGDRGGCGGGAR